MEEGVSNRGDFQPRAINFSRNGFLRAQAQPIKVKVLLKLRILKNAEDVATNMRVYMCDDIIYNRSIYICNSKCGDFSRKGILENRRSIELRLLFIAHAEFGVRHRLRHVVTPGH